MVRAGRALTGFHLSGLVAVEFSRHASAWQGPPHRGGAVQQGALGWVYPGWRCTGARPARLPGAVSGDSLLYRFAHRLLNAQICPVVQHPSVHAGGSSFLPSLGDQGRPGRCGRRTCVAGAPKHRQRCLSVRPGGWSRTPVNSSVYLLTFTVDICVEKKREKGYCITSCGRYQRTEGWRLATEPYRRGRTTVNEIQISDRPSVSRVKQAAGRRRIRNYACRNYALVFENCILRSPSQRVLRTCEFGNSVDNNRRPLRDSDASHQL